MMKELTRCMMCGRVLVGQEEVHAVKGSLYCSKACAIDDLTNDYITNAKELAAEEYNSLAEIVRTEDVLSEDLQEVEITVVCKKVIKLPADLSAEDALNEAEKLYKEGLVVIDQYDCDNVEVTYELVTKENSSCDEEA